MKTGVILRTATAVRIFEISNLFVQFGVVIMYIKQWTSVVYVCPYRIFTLFRHCPSLFKHAGEFNEILESWKEYKLTVPTYGAILLDPTLQFVSSLLQNVFQIVLKIFQFFFTNFKSVSYSVACIQVL